MDDMGELDVGQRWGVEAWWWFVNRYRGIYGYSSDELGGCADVMVVRLLYESLGC